MAFGAEPPVVELAPGRAHSGRRAPGSKLAFE